MGTASPTLWVKGRHTESSASSTVAWETVHYTPEPGYVGEDSFQFSASDFATGSEPATIRLIVAAPTPANPNGLTGLWKLDDSGRYAWDSSGRGNHGVHRGDPARAPGRIGNSLVLAGQDHVMVADSGSLDITTAITLSIWLKADSLTKNSGGLISKSSDRQKYGAAPANKAFELGVRFGTLYFAISDGADGAMVSGDEAAVIDGKWHHLAAVWEGIAAGGALKIYLDGQQKYETVSSISAIQSRNWTLDIGGAGQMPFRGSIDEVSLFDRALTSSEILQLASGTAFARTDVGKTRRLRPGSFSASRPNRR